MRGFSRIIVLLPAVLVLTGACATKGWVRETLDRKESEIGQRIDTVGQRVDSVGQRVDSVDGRVTHESQRIEGVGNRVGAVETRVGEVDQTARGAREVGTSALGKADDVDRRLTRLWTNRYNPKLVDTVNIRFGFDRADLDDGAQTALLGLVKELQANPGLSVELLGHTDMKGPRDYNYQLSQRRVESVRRFLAANGVELARIQSVGLGPITDRQTPEAEKRRVTARLMLAQD